MVLKKLGKIGLILSLPILFLTGCTNNENIVASISGYELDATSFLNELNLSRTTHKMSTNSDLNAEEIDDLADYTIEQLLLVEIFAKEGEKLGLAPSNEKAEELFAAAKESFSSIEGFQDILDSSGYTDEYIRETAIKSYTADTYYNHLYNSIAISGEDTKNFYEQNKDKLYTVELADAAHILFKTYTEDEDGVRTPLSDEEKLKVKKKAEEVLAKVKSGEDFNELAKTYSEEEGANESGGELGSFTKGQMVKEFETAAFSLKDGETSELVETEFGYHIIKLHEQYTNVYDYSNIESYVRIDLLDSLVEKKINELQAKYRVKLYEENIDKLLSNLEPITISDTEETSTEETTSEETSTEEASTEETTSEETNTEETTSEE